MWMSFSDSTPHDFVANTDIQVAMPVDFMNESAKEALRRSTFIPATIKGVPVTVRRVQIRVDVHY